MTQINHIQKRKYLILVGLSKKKTDYNAKITEIEGKMRIITGVTTTSALTAVENKISDISGLVKKKKKSKNIRH